MSSIIGNRFGELSRYGFEILRHSIAWSGLGTKTDEDRRQGRRVYAQRGALRAISASELAQTIQAHEQWLVSQGARGARASFRRTDLENADLREADLCDADFSRANLRQANLRQARLEHANLRHATLHAADLRDATLKWADLTDADLSHANLTRAKLREVCLQDADVMEVAGLCAEQLAGSDVSGAKLPPEIARFEGLAYIKELSQQSRNVFLAMVASCLFSWLTLATTTDVMLLTNSASSALPIIQARVPIVWFYLVMPVILIGLYFYLHLHLQRIWEGFGNLPAIFPDGSSLDARAYPWLLNSLARAHVALLKESHHSLSWMQVPVSIVSAWLLVPFTVLLFWLRYLPRHDMWGATGIVIVFFAVALVGMTFYRRAKQTLRGLDVDDGVHGSSRNVVGFMGVAALAVVLSELSVNSPHVANANLREMVVSQKPGNWYGESDNRLVRGASLNALDLRNADATRAFLVNADFRKTNLDNAILKEAGLHGAVLRKASLRGADLLRADLSEAKLLKADLRGANISEAVLIGAKLRDAKLAGAILSGANLKNVTHLTQAQLDQACGDGYTKLPYGLKIRPCKPHPHPTKLLWTQAPRLLLR